MGTIILDDAPHGNYEIIHRETGKSILIQVDWDYTGIAQTFGWDMRGKNCAHEGTDGTVTCPQCGKTATEFISEAADWLDNHLGTEAEDPGYFD